MGFYDKTNNYKNKNASWGGLMSFAPKRFTDFCRNKNCLKQVNAKVSEFSKKKFGVVLCWNCQRLDEWERSIEKDE